MGCCISGCSGGSDSESSDFSGANFCLGLTTGAKIIDGQACDNEASPVVKINLTDPEGTTGLCSGTVIGANKVLTAAHCFLLFKVKEATVSYGANTVKVTRTQIHPGVGTDGANLALFNDVAVLTTATNMNLPIVPIIASEEVRKGDSIGVQGFGLDQDGDFGENRGGAMLISKVTANHIFAAFNGEGSNPCNGDSGGPAIFTSSQGTVGVVGVVSTGNPDSECFEGDVTLFANLQTSSILDFVVSVFPGVEVR